MGIQRVSGEKGERSGAYVHAFSMSIAINSPRPIN